MAGGPAYNYGTSAPKRDWSPASPAPLQPRRRRKQQGPLPGGKQRSRKERNRQDKLNQPLGNLRPEVHVVPGGAKDRAAQTVPYVIAKAVKCIIAAAVVIAVIGAARVTLSSLTVSAALEASELTNSITEARSEGNALEVQQSILSNPTRIKNEAAAIGMVAPEQTTYIALGEDIVATRPDGSLSLSGSVSKAASR